MHFLTFLNCLNKNALVLALVRGFTLKKYNLLKVKKRFTLCKFKKKNFEDEKAPKIQNIPKLSSKKNA